MGEEREAVVVVCQASDQIVHHMNDKPGEKQKGYNTFKWSLAIAGVILILISFILDDTHTGKIIQWTGFGAVWGAVMMKFLDPSLDKKHRDTPDKK